MGQMGEFDQGAGRGQAIAPTESYPGLGMTYVFRACPVPPPRIIHNHLVMGSIHNAYQDSWTFT
jgi:hypothetical protein